MMEKVYNAYVVGFDGRVGVVISDRLKKEIEAEIVALLIEHQDECIAYDWTLNSSYEEDGEQVIIKYPSDFFKTTRERIKEMIGFNRIDIHNCLFTECDDRDEVEKLCQKVALGEIVPDERWGA